MRIGVHIVAILLVGALTTADAQTRPVEPPPVPRVTLEGKALSFDFPEVQIGVAEYEEGPTGATVLLSASPSWPQWMCAAAHPAP